MTNLGLFVLLSFPLFFIVYKAETAMAIAWSSLWLMLTLTDLTPACLAAASASPWSCYTS